MKKQKITRKQREKRVKIIGLVVLFVVLAGISAVVYFISDQPVAETVQAEETESSTAAEETASAAEETNEYEDNASAMVGYIQPYYEQNSDTVGYIRVPGTVIDYPVVYSGDNEYYMTINFEGEEAKGGAIFMDYRCDHQDFDKTRNVILYGHRMKDGTMFKGLTEYLDSDFYEENTIIQFDTLYEEHEWEVFAVFETTVDFYYIETEFANDSAWKSFMKSCYDISKYQEDIKFYGSDIVLTLSTCGLSDDKRFVVMARLIN